MAARAFSSVLEKDPDNVGALNNFLASPQGGVEDAVE